MYGTFTSKREPCELWCSRWSLFWLWASHNQGALNWNYLWKDGHNNLLCRIWPRCGFYQFFPVCFILARCVNNKGGDSAKPSETCFSVLTRHYDCEAVLLIYRSTTYIDCADRDSQKLHSVDGKTGTALDLSINHRSIVVMTLHKQYTYNQLFSLRQMDWLSFDDVGSRWGQSCT